MHAHTSPLLLLVQANIAPAQEDEFNSWYEGLYRVSDMDAMVRVMGAEQSLKDPRAIEERTRFDAITQKFDVKSNVYKPIASHSSFC